MNSASLRYLLFFLLLVAILTSGLAQDVTPPSQKDGVLVVLVTWGDTENTPATDVFAEAHGFVQKYRSEKSFVLKMSKPGQYEASLPPGVYDVFLSEGISVPRCRRVLITSGSTGYWTVKLETDDVYTDKSVGTK